MKLISTLLLACTTSFVFAGNTTGQKTPKPVMEIVVTEQSNSFVERMQESLPGEDQSQIIQRYLNSLLKVNAVYDREDPDLTPSVFYRVKFNNEGTLLVTRKQRDDNGMQIDVRRLTVYGLSHHLDYDCSWHEQLCWVVYPGIKKARARKGDGRWLEISYAPHAMDELVSGMGLLIKELQK